jgi:hypothetical protein
MVRRAGLGSQLLARRTLPPVSREHRASNPDYPGWRRTLPDHARLMTNDARLWHPWRRINRVLRVMLHTRSVAGLASYTVRECAKLRGDPTR